MSRAAAEMCSRHRDSATKMQQGGAQGLWETLAGEYGWSGGALGQGRGRRG